jgi:predicted nucleic acid-binding protein
MVIADTNIIIAAIRGNEMAKQLLLKYMPAVYISVVTEIELFTGATNISKKRTVEQIIKNPRNYPHQSQYQSNCFKAR